MDRWFPSSNRRPSVVPTATNLRSGDSIDLAKNWHWLLFYVSLLVAWLGLFSYAIPVDEWRYLGVYGWDLFFAVCALDPAAAGFISLLFMWSLMSAAMMLPTFIPTLRCYEELRVAGAGSKMGFVALIAGYLLVWFGFSALMAALQIIIDQHLSQFASGGMTTVYFTSGLFLLAGLYQFSYLKEACLSRCQNPFSTFMSHWREGSFSEPTIGIRIGIICLGCCWVLMSFALAGGSMSLVWMFLATIVLTLEKLPDIGRRVSAPLGFSLIIAAIISFSSAYDAL